MVKGRERAMRNEREWNATSVEGSSTRKEIGETMMGGREG